MARLLVTVGTDGFTDWVSLPSGQRLNLGPISVLHFVSKVTSGRDVRHAMDAFLRDGQASLKIEEDQMWDLLTPVRARWASSLAGSFMTQDLCPVKEGLMFNDTTLKSLENHVAQLKAAAGKASPQKMEQGRGILVRLASKVDVRAAQQQEDDKKEAEQQDEKKDQEKEASASQLPGLSFDTYKANSEIAGSIIAEAAETVAVIDRLASAGKKFNASRAKADVHAVTTKVASILREADLTKDWVQSDLQKLASHSTKLHKIFVPTKA